MMYRDQNYGLRDEIIQGINDIEQTEYLLRIWRLVKWCLDRQY